MENNNVSKSTVLSIVAVALVTFSGIMAETSMNVTFTLLAKQFGTDLNTIQWVTTAYLLSVTIMITTSAHLVKKYSLRNLWLTSIAIFIVGTLIGGTAPNLWILLLGRILEGIAAGIAMPLSFNIVMYTVPSAKIGTWMGVSSMVVSLAPSFGPTYGGLILDLLGWRAIFFILLIAPIASLIIGWRTVLDVNPRVKTHTFDLLAFGLLAGTLTLSLLIVNQLEGSQINWGAAGLWLAMLCLFIWRGMRSKQSFLDLGLFLDLRFVRMFIPIALYMFAMLGLNLIIPTFSENVLRTSSFIAGFLLLPGSLVGAFMNPLFGKMYDQYGPKQSVYLGNVIFMVAVLLMFGLRNWLGLWILIIMYIVFIIGRNMAYNSAQTEAIATQPQVKQSDATAIIQTFQMFMGALGTTVGALFQSKFGVANGLHNFTLLAIGIAIINGGLFWRYFKNNQLKQ
ncbi:MFS transporter [Nicoliella lavandulae]|uniref:MFS transporter n=1 Tax=Nicoliella lavandulae TaxID=3082954 RepID=A0ABU8SIN8_9LACO